MGSSPVSVYDEYGVCFQLFTMGLMPRLAINLFSLFLLSSLAVAQRPVKAVPPVPKAHTYEDFAHVNKGCPENSECDEVMGQLLLDWKKLAERWENLASSVKEKEMQEHMLKRGWPVEFYTKGSARSGLNPVLFSSSCSVHNPKDEPLNKIWRGQGFIKGSDKGQVVFSRGDTEFKIKQGELLTLRPIILHPEGGAVQKYLIPLDENPAYLEKGKMMLLVESEGVYALLGIPVDGAWQVQLAPSDDISSYFEDRSDVACPQGVPTAELPWFPKSHCQKILDKDSGKQIIAQFFWAC